MPVPFSEFGKRLRFPAIASLMSAALHDPDLLSLAAGFTDSASLPLADVGRAVRRLEDRNGPPEHLQYGTNQGRRGLRKLLAGRIALLDGRSVEEAEPDRVLVTNGSQQALYLATSVLCDPGDIVMVERPSYFVYLDMLRGKGVRVLELPEGREGSFDLEALGLVLGQVNASGGRIKIIYLESYFSNPTGASRTAEDKSGLARVLAAQAVHPVVIEDAAYRDLYFDVPFPATSILSLPAFRSLPCLYLGTLTKPYASGLKTGFGICTSSALLERMLWLKSHHDFGTANFNQAVLEEILREGGLERQMVILRRSYREKMKALDGALRSEGLATLGWSWTEPLGGIYLWLRAPHGLDTRTDSAFWKSCLEEKVFYVPGDLCYGVDAPTDRVRLSFGVLSPENLVLAASRFARAARKMAVPA